MIEDERRVVVLHEAKRPSDAERLWSSFVMLAVKYGSAAPELQYGGRTDGFLPVSTALYTP
jgi:hypothetical protein